MLLVTAQRFAIAGCLLGSLAAQTFPELPVPAGNPITPEKALLGKALFWDEQLSSTNTVACGTCHRHSAGGGDPRLALNPGPDGLYGTPDDVRGSPGVIAQNIGGQYVYLPEFGIREQVTRRAAPSVINSAYFDELFWDGRASDVFRDPTNGSVVLPSGAALENQAARPPISPVEMAHGNANWADIAARIADLSPLAVASDVPAELETWIGERSYRDLFEEVFTTNEVTPSRIVMAIATYQRTLVSDQSLIDRHFNDGVPVPQDVSRGIDVFLGSGLCFLCHAIEPSFAAYFNTGVRPIEEDRGRGALTGFEVDQGAFKVPTLRNLTLRSTFFHNGGLTTLEEVVEFYDRGGDFAPSANGPMFVLNLPETDKAALVAFLEALTDPRVEQELPPFDRPILFTERVEAGEHVTEIGVGTNGTFGFVPEVVAIEPPVLGNPEFTLGVGNAVSGMPAALLLDVAGGDGSVAFQGVPLYLGLTPGLQFLDLGVLAGNGWGQGHASLSFPIPNVGSLGGVALHLQLLMPDPGGPQGYAGSSAKRVELFAPR